MQAALKGADVVMLAGAANRFVFSFMARPEIKKISDLRGRKIGITRLGSVTDFALRTIIERHNIKDVNVLQMGGFPEAVAGLSRACCASR